MKKTFIYLAIVSLAALTFASCGGGDDKGSKITGIPASVSANAIELDLKVEGTGDWQLESNAAWMIAEPRTGNGNADFKLKISENNSTEAREAQLSIKNGKKYTIKQDGGIAVTGNEAEVVAGGKADLKLTVKASADWTVTPVDSWLSVTPANGNSGETTVTVNVAANTSDPREGKLTFTSGDFNKTVVIKQAGIQFIDELVGTWVVTEEFMYFTSGEFKFVEFEGGTATASYEIYISKYSDNSVKIVNMPGLHMVYSDFNDGEENIIVEVDNEKRSLIFGTGPVMNHATAYLSESWDIEDLVFYLYPYVEGLPSWLHGLPFPEIKVVKEENIDTIHFKEGFSHNEEATIYVTYYTAGRSAEADAEGQWNPLILLRNSVWTKGELKESFKAANNMPKIKLSKETTTMKKPASVKYTASYKF